MRAIIAATAFAVIATVALAVASPNSLEAVHPAILNGSWRRHDALTSALGDKTQTMHRVWVSLKQQNTEQIEKLFWTVSDPKSPSYGKYLSQAEVTAIVAPNPTVIASVTAWLQAGRDDVTVDFTANRDAALVTLPLSHVETLFGVQMHAYVPNPSLLMRADTVLYRSNVAATLPPHIAQHVSMVHGISNFPPVTKRQANRIRAAKAARTAAATAKSTLAAGASGGTPVIERARGRNGAVQLWFTPTCVDGSVPNGAPGAMCNTPSAGSTLLSFQITAATTINPTPATYTQTITAANVCDVESGAIACHISLEVPWYDAYTTSVTATFGNGNSFTAVNANVVANIPPVTPQKLWQYYGLGDAPRTTTNVTQCVVEFEQQYYAQSDLLMFFDEMGLPADTPVTVIGPNDQTNPGGEADLDIQWMMAMAPGSPTTFWSIAANSSAEIDDILQWAYAIGNVTNPPQVNSLSYGMTEGNVDAYLGHGYTARSDVEFQKLALQGLTIIIADGDTGAGDLGGPPMGNSDCQVLHPDWPSQSPYITAVGSTYLTPNSDPVCYLPAAEGGIDCSKGPDGEVGVALNFGIHWTTGGGFSNMQNQAWYQADVVNAYLARGSSVLPPSNMFNSTGRAYPDVVTCGHNLITAVGGVFDSIDGTSASAPIFAGLVTMWNDARVAAGKSVLGFLNPMMYSLTTAAFRDVVIGDNHCGGEGDTCCSAAYHASVGWDAVTGLGSPAWAEVTKQILALP